ncbi:MAG TPA: GlsB/YeaQ/YmgE family stress response membrane protein [Candidatus Limnocylindrales bacterium]|nr:GlsB/YeaQ/YmgE family stress response membrane protein [Candidatus Limnocylindrales bacterium]
MGLFAWIFLGLISGALAKLIMPGHQGGGFFRTTLLGVAGALIGGFVGARLLGFGEITGFDLRSMAIAVGGALLVLFVFGLASQDRTAVR